MKDSRKRKEKFAIISLLSVLMLAACGKAIPVQELEAAHEQITAAENENAAEYANESYTQAREALLAAHQNLADDDLSKAKENALKAQALAIETRKESAPRSTAKKGEASQSAIQKADEAYAEALAPRDFAAAKELYEDAARLESNAKTLSADETKTFESLQSYSEASRKYDASANAATKARSLALSQKGDILDSLAGIKSKLEKAEIYGAEQEDPEGLAAAKAELSKAEGLIKADKLKDGHAAMKGAEEKATALLAAVEAKYADKKLAEAKEAVRKSEKHFASINTPANKKSLETKALLATLNEQVGAAGEALKSSEGYYADKKYSDSINESEEAIRLSQIIFEKSNMLARARKANLDVGGSDEDSEAVSGDVKTYRVKKTRPADSLWRIAKKKQFYGNGRYWTRIYKANKSKIKNPNLIYPGQRFVIPPKKGPIVTKQPGEKAASEGEKTLEERLKEEAAKKVTEEVEKKTEEMEQPRENEGE